MNNFPFCCLPRSWKMSRCLDRNIRFYCCQHSWNHPNVPSNMSSMKPLNIFCCNKMLIITNDEASSWTVVPRWRHVKCPLVSRLQMLKRCVEWWSLTWHIHINIYIYWQHIQCPVVPLYKCWTASKTWWQTSKMESGVTLTNFETLAQMMASHLADSQNAEWFHAKKC